MLNFTVGPVQSNEKVREIGSQQVPYFRNQSFSQVVLESEKLLLEFANAEEGSRAVFVTGSGTASMDATVLNLLTKEDNAIIVNGGSFGQRFVDICNLYEIPNTEIKLEIGKTLTNEDLEKIDASNHTAFLVNVHETSTGVFYDLKMISEFCKKHNLLLIVDAISSFLADEIDMKGCGIDVLITGSQKALACPPGVSIIMLSKRAIERVFQNNPKTFYLNIKSMLSNGERGQTPFTPAVSIIKQIHARLCDIKANGGVKTEIDKTHRLAEYFRENIKNLPFEFVSNKMSNAVTSLHPKNVSAYDIFLTLERDYQIWICPNGGELKDKIFRVGHIGYLTEQDFDKLILALNDMNSKGLL